MRFYFCAPIVLAGCSVMRPLDVTPRPAVGLPERFIVDSTFKPIPRRSDRSATDEGQ